MRCAARLCAGKRGDEVAAAIVVPATLAVPGLPLILLWGCLCLTVMSMRALQAATVL